MISTGRKKVIVVTSDVPFVRGGHRLIAENTTNALNDNGYRAELHYTPQNRFGRQLSAYLINRLTDLDYTEDNRGVDRIISMRFPSYAVKHRENILWLVHRLREYYDLWENYKNMISWKGRIKETVRRFLVHRLDEYFLSTNVKRIYTISSQVSERLLRWGGFESKVLYPPVTPSDWRCEEYGNYFLAVSRLMKHKRLDLFINAAALVKDSSIKFVLVGGGPEEQNLKTLIKKNNLVKRFELTGQVGQDELTALYARARAVVFTPLREEFGFVTLEAFRSDKPVITTTDSGGPTELVKNEKCGYVVEPDAGSIAEKMDILSGDPALARRMGEEGNRSTSYITWKNTIKELMKPL